MWFDYCGTDKMIINVDPLSIHNPGMLMAHSTICDPSNVQIKQRLPPISFSIVFFSIHFDCHSWVILLFSSKHSAHARVKLNIFVWTFLCGVCFLAAYIILYYIIYLSILINSSGNGDIILIALIAWCIVSIMVISVENTQKRQIKTYWVLDFTRFYLSVWKW